MSFTDPSSYISIRTGISGLIGIANIEQYVSVNNYFDEQVGQNSFTHYWSLGVEEQYYAIFPLLILALTRVEQRIGRALIIVVPMLASFVAYVVGTYSGWTEATFYLLPFRYWEIGIGVALAFLGTMRDYLSDVAKKAVVLIGVLTICIMFSTGDETSTVALTLVISSTVIVVQMLKGWTAQDGVTLRFAASIGRRSYSLYLVHWVLLVVVRSAVELDFSNIFLFALLTLTLAELNYRFVELRFLRETTTPRFRNAGIFFTGSLALLLIIGFITRQDQMVGQQGSTLIGSERYQSCTNENSKRWLVGDSHADRYSNILAVYYSDDCIQIRDSTTQYGLFFDLVGGNPRHVKFGDGESFMQRVKNERPTEIWIVNYLQGLFQDQRDVYQSADWTIDNYDLPGEDTNQWRSGLDYLIARYEQLLEAAAEVGTNVFIELPPPDFDWIGQGGLLWRDENKFCRPNGLLSGVRAEYAEVCVAYDTPAVVARSEVERRRYYIVSQLRELKTGHSNLRLIDPLDALCSRDQCSTHRDGLRLFEDDDHYSAAGQIEISKKLALLID